MSLEENLTRTLEAGSFTTERFRDNLRVLVAPEKFLGVMTLLKQQLGFDYLVDVTGIDYLHYPNAKDRYGVVYSLANTTSGERVFVKVALNDPSPTVASVYPLWNGANWLEREVFDMFGVNFVGHPDLRRILMPA